MSDSVPRTVKWAVTAAVIAAFLLIDFAVPQFDSPRNNWPLAVGLGICMGQLNLITTWAVFARGNIVVRLPWSLLLGVFTAVRLGCRKSRTDVRQPLPAG